MRVEYTPDERRRLIELRAAMKAIDTRDEDFYALHPYPTVMDGKAVPFEVPSDDEDSRAFWQLHNRARKLWQETAPDGWWEEHLRRDRLEIEDRQALRDRINDIRNAAHDRAFASLGNDPALIMKDAQAVIQEHIAEALDYYREQEAIGGDREWASFDVLSLGGSVWKLNAIVIKDILMGKNLPEFDGSPRTLPQSTGSPLSRHFKALEGMKDLTGAYYTDLLEAHIDDCLSSHPAVMWPVEGEDYAGAIAPSARLQITADYRRSPYAIMPISKLSQKLRPAIRDAMDRTLPITFGVDVGNNAIVNASIETQGVDLTNFEIAIQNVIGEMVQANGGKKLFVTPAQIFREYAALQKGERVAPTSEAVVVKAVDKMLGLSSSIDFEQQLSKHTNIRRVKGIEYKGGKLSGRFIEGRKVENIHAGGHIVPVGYVFYDLPMFFLYSHLVRQVTNVPKRLLNPTIKTISAPGARPKRVKAIRKTPENMLLMRYLAQQIDRMQSAKASSKNGEYESRLRYETIAGNTDIVLTDKTRRKLMTDVDTLLRAYVEDGHVKGHERYYTGRAATGVKILL